MIKKAIFAIAAIAVLSGCVGHEYRTEEESKTYDLNVYKDRKYGCEYVAAGSGSLLPRLNKDGQHVGCEK